MAALLKLKYKAFPDIEKMDDLNSQAEPDSLQKKSEAAMERDHLTECLKCCKIKK